MPSYNGVVAGRIDADTFRMWKGTKHPAEAFEVLAYLTGPAVTKLIIGTADMKPAYGAFPARTADQGAWLDAKKLQFPAVTNWQVILDGLSYPDVPSAEGWMPNYNEAWARGATFQSLMYNEGGLDLEKEIATYLADLDVIFNK
jgi:multiple sugar transport system substrate-binding protein